MYMTIWSTQPVSLHLLQLFRAVQFASREAVLRRVPDGGSVLGDERTYFSKGSTIEQQNQLTSAPLYFKKLLRL